MNMYNRMRGIMYTKVLIYIYIYIYTHTFTYISMNLICSFSAYKYFFNVNISNELLQKCRYINIEYTYVYVIFVHH